MSKSKAVPDHIRIRNEEELHRFFYEYEDQLRIEQYDKYTFRLFAKNGRIVDVWPARRRYYNRMMNESRTYQSPKELRIVLGLK